MYFMEPLEVLNIGAVASTIQCSNAKQRYSIRIHHSHKRFPMIALGYELGSDVQESAARCRLALRRYG